MSSLLIKNIGAAVTCDEEDRVFKHTSILIEDGVIARIGADAGAADQELDARGGIVYPGLINTHHHLYQTYSRNIPAVQNLELFAWLKGLYGIWKHMDEDVVYYAALVGLADLVRHGATTVMDHHYVFNEAGDRFMDALFAAADAIGVRLHAARGSMSRGESKGGLPPDSVVQDTDRILADSEAAVKKFHDPSPFSYRQVVLAPCSPFSVTPELMVQSARLARSLGVRLHTHLAETRDESRYVLETENMRPLAYMESLEWTGPDVWFAHGIHFDDDELLVLQRTGSGVAHCPVSNMKLSSGVCRVREMLALGIPVGLAVDGSASNDGSNLLAEIRAGYLLHRLHESDQAPSAGDMLKIATNGSATLLGRDDALGMLKVGMAGDLFILDVNRLEYVGSDLDPKALPAAIGYAGDTLATVVGGQVVASEGRLTGIDEARAVSEAKKVWRRYLTRAGVLA